MSKQALNNDVPTTTGTFDVIVEVGTCPLCDSTLRALVTYQAELETDGLKGQTIKRSMQVVAVEAETFDHSCVKIPANGGGFSISTAGVPRRNRVRGYNRLGINADRISEGTITAERLARNTFDE